MQSKIGELSRLSIDTFGLQWNLELDPHRSSAQRGQIQQLGLIGVDDLHHDDVGWICELEFKEVKLRDV